MYHLFFKCLFANDVWCRVLSWFKLSRRQWTFPNFDGMLVSGMSHDCHLKLANGAELCLLVQSMRFGKSGTVGSSSVSVEGKMILLGLSNT